MTDVNERTEEKYEPEWDGQGPPPAGRRRVWRAIFGARMALAVLGAAALGWGLFALWGPPAAAIFGGFALLRFARFRRYRHGWHHRGFEPGSPGRPRFHFGCGHAAFRGAPFRQPPSSQPMV
jgi:hypothetical protein